jgi:prophage regulatory protein
MMEHKRPLRFLRLKQVIARTGLPRSSIYLMVGDGRFPRQVRLSGSRSVAWVEAEVEDWMQARIEASRSTD